MGIVLRQNLTLLALIVKMLTFCCTSQAAQLHIYGSMFIQMKIWKIKACCPRVRLLELSDDRVGPGVRKMLTPFALQIRCSTNTLQYKYKYIAIQLQICCNTNTLQYKLEIATGARWQQWEISALCGMSRMPPSQAGHAVQMY